MLELPRQRTAGEVSELTVRDLAFSLGEVAAFYRQKNIELTDEEVEKLAQRTGGIVTVKTHLTRLYGKLGAVERREAVERARLSGLLPKL